MKRHQSRVKHFTSRTGRVLPLHSEFDGSAELWADPNCKARRAAAMISLNAMKRGVRFLSEEPSTMTQPTLFSAPQPVTQEGFDVYDTENPAIYDKLAQFATEAHRAGATHIGIGMLYERLRWYTKVEARDDTFKVNNNYRAFYARKLMRDFPVLEGIFETRTSKADA